MALHILIFSAHYTSRIDGVDVVDLEIDSITVFDLLDAPMY